MPCWAYRLLFAFKQTRLAGWLFFDTHEPFTVLDRNVTIVGTVTQIAWHEADGDHTFDVAVDPPARWAPTLHCEITPCTAASLGLFMADLAVGHRVQVQGDHCFDPPHFGEPGGGHEIHPVRAGQILQGV